MELATPFIVVAAAHPSLDGAVRRCCDTLRTEIAFVGRRGAISSTFMTALVGRLEASTPDITLAAVADGEVIGLARIDEAAPAGPDLIIAVAAPWRGQGVAMALGRAIVARAHAVGIPRIVVRTSRRGAELHGLADALGFQAFDLGHGRLDLVRSLEPAIRSA